MDPVSPSDRDRARMEKQAQALPEIESFTPASPDQRRKFRAWINPRRASIGLPELKEPDEPPEVGFVRGARERGLLRTRHGTL